LDAAFRDRIVVASGNVSPSLFSLWKRFHSGLVDLPDNHDAVEQPINYEPDRRFVFERRVCRQGP
jgi:hypothetical protein